MSKPSAGKVTPIKLYWAKDEDYRKATYQVGTFHRVTVKRSPTANEGVTKRGNKASG